MIPENEIVMFLICVGIFVFVINKYREYTRIPYWQLILGSFGLFFVAVIMTITESFFWEDFLNLLEHLFYLLSALAMLVWCWITLRCRKEGE